MKIKHGIYDGINTIDELINTLNQLKEKHGGKTKVVGSSIINMGMGYMNLKQIPTLPFQPT